MANPRTQTSTVASGATLGSAVATYGEDIVGWTLDSAFDGTTLQFSVSRDGGTTYGTLYNKDGIFTCTVAASAHLSLGSDALIFSGCTHVKPIAGTQTGDTILTPVFRCFR